MTDIVRGQKLETYNQVFSGYHTIVLLRTAINNPNVAIYYVSGSDRRATYGISKDKIEYSLRIEKERA